MTTSPPHDQFGAFQGLVHRNGSARDEAEAACLRGLGLTSGG